MRKKRERCKELAKPSGDRAKNCYDPGGGWLRLAVTNPCESCWLQYRAGGGYRRNELSPGDGEAVKRGRRVDKYFEVFRRYGTIEVH